MTPERIEELAESAWLQMDFEPTEGELAIQRAIRQAVNEAISESESVADEQIRLAEQIKDPAGYTVATEIRDAIRALKLPEE